MRQCDKHSHRNEPVVQVWFGDDEVVDGFERLLHGETPRNLQHRTGLASWYTLLTLSDGVILPGMIFSAQRRDRTH